MSNSSVSSSSSSSLGEHERPSEDRPKILLTTPSDHNNNQVKWDQSTSPAKVSGSERRNNPLGGPSRRSPLPSNSPGRFNQREEDPIVYAYSSPNLRALNNNPNYEQARLADGLYAGVSRPNYVDPLYQQLNPTRNSNKKKPVWSLNQPLPHVVDQAMVDRMLQKKRSGNRSRQSSRPGSTDVSRSGSMTSMNDWKKLIRKTASNLKLTDLEAQIPVPHATPRPSGFRADSSRIPSEPAKNRIPHGDVNFSLGDESSPPSVLDEEPQKAKNGNLDNVTHKEYLPTSPDKEYREAAQGGDGGVDVNDAGDDESEEMEFPNFWAKIRYTMREPFAECFGTLILVIFGVGGNLQATVTKGAGGSFESLSFAWGFGCMLGVYVAGGISGGHINPAVTISMAIFRKFPWKKVPVYIFAQIVGAFFGGAMAYGYFWSSITEFEGGKDIRTANLSGACLYTDPKPYVTWRNAFFDEFIGGAILVGCLMALLDDTNAPPASGMTAFIVGLLVAGIGMALGYQTSFTINPARDLGPRIFAAMVGYGRHPFQITHYWWSWGAWGGPIAGGIAGALVYDIFIFTGSESPINYPDKGYVERRIGKLLHNEDAADEKTVSPDADGANSSDTLVRNQGSSTK